MSNEMFESEAKWLNVPLLVLFVSLAMLHHARISHQLSSMPASMLSYIVTQVETAETYEVIEEKSRITSFRCNTLCILNKNGCNRVKKTNTDENGLLDCQLLKVIQKTSLQLSSPTLVEEIRDRDGYFNPDGAWSSWQTDGGCSVSCGAGLMSERRTCTSPAPIGDGKDCMGDDSRDLPCSSAVECEDPVDGGWSDWENVGNCSKICGTGKQKKARSCTNPEPIGGGLNCTGTKNTQIDCNTFECKAQNLHLMNDEGPVELTDIDSKTALINMDEGEAWIVIQNNVAGNLDFNRSWAEYKTGFGNISANEDFWIGNNVIRVLCNLYSNLRLRIQLISATRNDVVGYSVFCIEEEAKNFKLNLDDYSGNLEDSFKSSHGNKEFSTFDRDNDDNANKNCASEHGSGWWFKNCFQVSLNSRLKWNDIGNAIQYEQSVMKIQINTN